MDSDERTSPNRKRRAHPWKRRQRKWLALVGIAFALLAAFSVYRSGLRREVEKRLKAFHAAGIPTAVESFEEWRGRIPVEENGAEAYLAAFNAFRPLTPDAAENLPLWGPREFESCEPYPDDVREASRLLLADNDEALRLMHLGATHGRSRFPCDIGMERQWPNQHAQKFVIGARMLALEASLAAETDQPDQAAEALLDLFTFVTSTDKEPIRQFQFSRLASLHLACETLERVVNRSTLSDAQLKGLGEALDAADTLEPLYTMAVWNLCVGVTELSSQSGWGDPSRLLGLPVSLGPAFDISGLIDRNLINFLDTMNEFIETTRMPLGEMGRRSNSILQGTYRLNRLTGAYTVWIVQGSANSHEVFAQYLAKVRAARTAVAVERYRLAKGQLPEKLGDLLPDFIEAVPEAPYGGEPIHYSRTDRGYSVHFESGDQGGERRSEAQAYREEQDAQKSSFRVAGVECEGDSPDADIVQGKSPPGMQPRKVGTRLIRTRKLPRTKQIDSETE